MRQLIYKIYTCKSFKHRPVITIPFHSAKVHFQNVFVPWLHCTAKNGMLSFISRHKKNALNNPIF